MSAVFTYAVRYDAEAVCLTPLRSGAGETEDVLRDESGRMFLQGSSIAGALRDWVTDTMGAKTAECLFGSRKCSGSLMVSDGVFDTDAVMTVRPRLRIDPAAGSAAHGGKFDIAHVSTGSRLRFTLIWLGSASQAEQPELVEQILAALDQGMIRLGGQKSNGFGRVSLKVRKRGYDLTEKADREDWMNDVFNRTFITLPEIKGSGLVTFEVRAHADQLLVKAGSSVQEEGEKAGSYAPHLTENGKAVIPGSSIKGAVLSRVRSIAKLTGVPEATVDGAFGRVNRQGDNGLAGRFRFEDADYEAGKKQKITRIRIDRFTGGVIRGGMFREEPVTGDLVLHISGPDDQQTACGLLLYALRDLGLGLYNLGSGGAIGRGYLKISEITARRGADKLVLRFEKNGGCSLEDEAGMAEEWACRMGGNA